MSQSFGLSQRWLLEFIGLEPVSLKQILAQAYPKGSLEGDMAKVLESSNISPTRSLHRALRKLVELGVIQIIGRHPHHYRLHPFFKGCEHNPRSIAILCRILEGEDALTPTGCNPLKAMSQRKNASATTKNE
jgi:hypothetical protein